MRYASYGPSDDDEVPGEEDVRRWSPPDNEVPGAVPVSVLLARTDDVAVALGGVRAYTTGVAFTLSVRLRTERVLPRRRDLHDLMGGWGGPGEGQLLLGVEFSDGRAASTAGSRRLPAPGSGLDQPLLVESGGGGGERSHDQEYWLAPVPPPGPLSVVLACAGLGIDETVVQLDGDALVQAAAQAQVLWPWQPVEEQLPHAEPELPSDSWFGRLRGEPDEPG